MTTWHNEGVRADGTLAMWGYGMEPPEGDGFVSVSAGGIHHLALKDDGSIVAWGNNNFGACDVPAIYDFIDIATGGYHSLALRANGSLLVWGDNYWGQYDIPDGNDFVAISAGLTHSLALRVDGTVIGWGGNLYGECDVPELSDDMRYVAIDAALRYNLAIVEPIPEPASVFMILVGVPFIGARARRIAKHRNYNT